jgi:hypothetical protein
MLLRSSRDRSRRGVRRFELPSGRMEITELRLLSIGGSTTRPGEKYAHASLGSFEISNFKSEIASAQISSLTGHGPRFAGLCQFNRDRFEEASSMRIPLCRIEYPAHARISLRRSTHVSLFTNHQLLLTTHRISNRHTHGLESPVSPFAFNKTTDSNRHRFGGGKSGIRSDNHCLRRPAS